MNNVILSHYETLIFYDTPLLFVSSDQIGTKYICLVSEQGEDFDTVICVPVSKTRLQLFCIGSVELREIILKPEIDFVYLSRVNDYTSTSLISKAISPSEILESWLPEEGFYYNQYETTEDEILIEAKEKARGIIHLSLSNEETKYNPKINSVKLAETLIAFQNLIKYAYKKAIKSLPERSRKHFNDPKYYSIDAFAFSPGSFKVKLQSNAPTNLVGESEISRALTIIDNLVSNIEDQDESLRLLTDCKGHLANTYIKFLKTITTNKTAVDYRWGSSANKKSVNKQISLESALELYDLFNQKEYLKEESVTIEGVVDKVDAKTGSWRLIDNEGKSHTGNIKDGSNVTLAGVIIKKITYEFICIEKIVEVLGTGEEKVELQLINYTKKNNAQQNV